MLDHMEYLVNLIGDEHVGIGTDSLFGDHVRLHKELLFSGRRKPTLIRNFAADYMKGIESPAEGYNIIRGLVDRGYSDDEILNIIGGNAVRVFRRVFE